MERVAITSAVRTPIGRYTGRLRDVVAYDLSALVLNEAVKRAKVDPTRANSVVMAQCYQSGEYVNIARKSLFMQDGQLRFRASPLTAVTAQG